MIKRSVIRESALLVCGLLIVYMFISVIAMSFSTPCVESPTCSAQLRAIGQALYIYAQPNGEFPDKIERLIENKLIMPDDLVCRKSGKTTNSFIYQPGLTNDSPPSEVLLVELPGNHEGGGNVLYQDGHVEWGSTQELKELLIRLMQE